MSHESKKIERLYLTLTLTNTLAASFIWGINTLFLLDAGLSIAQAFLVNAFFTLGQVIFEVPTGIIADSKGRRASYLLGTLTLGISTGLYLLAWHIQAPLLAWIIISILLGLGFTFFSGATEAWLVDALKYTKFKKTLESVFAKGQIVGGVAMLFGTVLGGLVAQVTNLGIPYILRLLVLGLNFILAYLLMKDLGFTAQKNKNIMAGMKKILAASVKNGLGKRSVRWVMLAGPFSAGVGIYAFYAMQPYLLELYGNSEAYFLAGIAAAVVAGAQIVGGFLVPYLIKLFDRRTSILILSVVLNAILLALIGFATNFVVAIGLLVIWGLVFAAKMPVRQAYLNKLIPSKQRATVLSFDSLIGSSGGVFIQPALGKAADVWSYSMSFFIAGAFQILALPFLILARKEKASSDKIVKE